MPLTVSENAALPTVAVVGVIAAMVGANGRTVMSIAWEVPPIGDGLTTVAVKIGLGASSARQIPPLRARTMIEEGAKAALADLTAVAPWSPGSPCEITVEFKHTLAADALRFRPGVVRVDDRTISVTADTWWEAWKAFYF